MGRAPCCDKANVKRGPWSPEEDIALKSYVEMHGTGGNWIALPQKAGLKRCGKSCRLRWLNYLRPGIKHGGFTEGEDDVICSLYKSIGSRWSVIASHLPGRTDNDVKNYWNTKLKKKLLTPRANPDAEENNNRGIYRTRHGTSPSPLSRALRVVKSEDYGVRSFSASADYSCSSTLTSMDDAHLGFNLEPASLPAPALGEPPNCGGSTSGYVVSPPHGISAASPSFTTENSNAYASWPDIGSSEIDAFLFDLGFGPMELVGAGGLGLADKVGDAGSMPVGKPTPWSHTGSKPKELYQGFTYS